MHLLAMTAFALIVSVVFAIISKHTPAERFRYGVKVFLSFMGIGLGLAYVMYHIR